MSGEVTDSAKRAEIDRNLNRFLELLPGLLQDHRNEVVLMRSASVVGYYPSAIEAQIAGNRQFADRLFSIQQIKEVAEELGHYAYAVYFRGSITTGRLTSKSLL
jgi:hypothetical protein